MTSAHLYIKPQTKTIHAEHTHNIYNIRYNITSRTMVQWFGSGRVLCTFCMLVPAVLFGSWKITVLVQLVRSDVGLIHISTYYSVIMTQVHVRTRPCFGRDDVTCNCAVAFRENNNVLGVFACRGGPPIPVRYLTDPLAPAGDITVSRDGIQYTVCVKLVCNSGRYVSRYRNGWNSTICWCVNVDRYISSRRTGHHTAVWYYETCDIHCRYECLQVDISLHKSGVLTMTDVTWTSMFTRSVKIALSLKVSVVTMMELLQTISHREDYQVQLFRRNRSTSLNIFCKTFSCFRYSNYWK